MAKVEVVKNIGGAADKPTIRIILRAAMRIGFPDVMRPSAKFIAVLVCTITIAMASPRQFTADMVAAQDIGITKFEDVVASVINSDLSVQARFAEISIEIMVAAYMAEIERLNARAGAVSDQDPSWQLGTLRYIEGLRTIAASIQPGSAVQIIKEPHAAIRLLIDGQQVMLSAPRLEGQLEFERSIAETACRFSNCRIRPATIEDRVTERASRLDGGWVFGRKTLPTYASSDGLQCVFNDRRHLKLKKDACLDLVHELRLLAEAFAALNAHRKPIDWRALRIEQVGAGQEQKITYNSSGSFVRMHLPRLSRAVAIWRGAIPWMKANIHGRVSQHVITLPDQLIYLTSTNES